MRRLAMLGGGVVLLVLLVLVVPQLVLPGIAAQQLRDHLKRQGTVLDVKVDAFPAIELLWHQADRVVVRMGRYASSSGKLSSTLSQVADVGTLDASARRMTAGLLTLRDASLRKRGTQLTGTGTVTLNDLRASFPLLDGVQLLGSSGGQLTLQGTATALGVTVTADATVRPQNGALLVAPNLPLLGLAPITLFSNPKIAVDRVAASPAPGGFTLTTDGRLR
jgi:DUF2993 family protein